MKVPMTISLSSSNVAYFCLMQKSMQISVTKSAKICGLFLFRNFKAFIVICANLASIGLCVINSPAELKRSIDETKSW
jgi:hypothetical protein